MQRHWDTDWKVHVVAGVQWLSGVCPACTRQIGPVPVSEWMDNRVKVGRRDQRCPLKGTNGRPACDCPQCEGQASAGASAAVNLRHMVVLT